MVSIQKTQLIDQLKGYTQINQEISKTIESLSTDPDTKIFLFELPHDVYL